MVKVGNFIFESFMCFQKFSLFVVEIYFKILLSSFKNEYDILFSPVRCIDETKLLEEWMQTSESFLGWLWLVLLRDVRDKKEFMIAAEA